MSDKIYQFRWQITIFLLGLIAAGIWLLFLFRTNPLLGNVEVIESREDQQEDIKLVVEISGEVIKPGVYSLNANSRIEDLLSLAGGLGENADTSWIARSLNRASKLTDGQKIFIPSINQSAVLSANNNSTNFDTLAPSDRASTKIININTASQKDLESLWGIGPVLAQNIIEQRPYSSTEELLTKKIIKANVYEKISEKITIY